MTGFRYIILLIVTLFVAGVAGAQTLTAYHVVGKVTYTAQGSTKPVVMNTRLTMQTVVNIPYGGKLELLDEAHATRITLTQPGKGTVKALSETQSKSLTKLSGKYVSYVKKQLTNKGLTSRQRYTDMATVTRRRDSVAAQTAGGGMGGSLADQFNLFKKQSTNTFESFRDECNRKYIAFVREAWKRFNSSDPVPMPKEQEVKPVVFTDTTKATDRFLFFGKRRKHKKVDSLDTKIGTKPDRNKIVEEIKPVPVPQEEQAYALMPVSFFGSDYEVHVDETKRLNLGEITPDRVADMLQVLSTKDYDNLLYDCLTIKRTHKLCDWAYLLLLQAVCNQFCGEGTNEAALLLGYLYYQSGYKVRFATDGTRLSVLVGTRHRIFDKATYNIDGELFYPLDDISGTISICNATFPNERGMSLYINDAQDFPEGNDSMRTVTSRRYPDITCRVGVNKSLIDFYNSYPASYVGDDFTTRWMMYAETPMEDAVKRQLYPQLQKELAGLDKREAVERLLNFVQTGFEYAYDDDVWGGDRTFFAEETLFYPVCDCEDRAILFTRLVRDLLQLPCVLVYYPGHLASAVNFPQEEKPQGDYYTYQDKNYTVCDPTYINAGVGMEMPGLEDGQAVLIPLK